MKAAHQHHWSFFFILLSLAATQGVTGVLNSTSVAEAKTHRRILHIVSGWFGAATWNRLNFTTTTTTTIATIAIGPELRVPVLQRRRVRLRSGSTASLSHTFQWRQRANPGGHAADEANKNRRDRNLCRNRHSRNALCARVLPVPPPRQTPRRVFEEARPRELAGSSRRHASPAFKFSLHRDRGAGSDQLRQRGNRRR